MLWKPRFGYVRPVNRWRESRGQAALLVAVSIAIVSLLGMTVVTLAFAQKKAAHYYADRMQAYYVAEDGIEGILAGVYQDWTILSGVPESKGVLINRLMPEGSLRVEGYRRPLPMATELTLESRGTYKNANRNVTFRADLYAPVRFEDGIVVSEEPEIDPEASPVASYRIGNVPEISAGWLRNRADTVTEGDAQITGVSKPGLHFFNGALRVYGGAYPVKAIFFASGDVTFESDFRLDEGCAVFITPGNVQIRPDNRVWALIVAGGEVRLEKGAHLTGGLVANRLYAGPESRITVDADCPDRALPVFTRGMKVKYWKDRSIF